ncbi:MAG: hypothetical protein AAF658_15405, partial [Myxococcota bacterium]
MRLSLSGLVALVLLVPGTALAMEVTASGDAEIRTETIEKVEEIALGRAMTAALEKVVGITVQSDFSADLREVVHNNQNRFDANVRDRVLKQSKGFIERYEIINSSKATVLGREVLRVTIRADVYESKVRAEVKRLAGLLARAGNPRVMVVVQELVRDLDGTTRFADTPMLASSIEEAFKKQGFLLQGATRAAELRATPEGDFDAFQSDDARALEVARAEGADVLVAGRMVIKNGGKVGKASQFKALANRVKIEVSASLRVLIVATGEVVSPAPLMDHELGSDFDRAVFRFFNGSKGRGHNVVEKFMGRFLP